jgi:hypothetical protein
LDLRNTFVAHPFPHYYMPFFKPFIGKSVSFLLSGLFFLNSCVSINKSIPLTTRWDQQKAKEWGHQYGWMAGCNFIPSYAVNQLEMWQAETYQPKLIDQELAMAENLGFKVVRVFLHHKVWEADRNGFKQRMEHFLLMAHKHGIKTMFVFFDDCWNEESQLGGQPLPKPYHNSGWVRDPGLKNTDNKALFPLLEEYVKDVMNHFARDKRVLMWDLYNEPGNAHPRYKMDLLQAVFVWARQSNATQPLTSGFYLPSSLPYGRKITKFQIENSDVISFHSYAKPKGVLKTIKKALQLNRPIVCSEYMARTKALVGLSGGNTFEQVLPLLKENGIIAINWGLVYGKTNTIYPWGKKKYKEGEEPPVWFHDIFRKDGSPFSEKEVEIIKSITKPQEY